MRASERIKGSCSAGEGGSARGIKDTKHLRCHLWANIDRATEKRFQHEHTHIALRVDCRRACSIHERRARAAEENPYQIPPDVTRDLHLPLASYMYTNPRIVFWWQALVGRRDCAVMRLRQSRILLLAYLEEEMVKTVTQIVDRKLLELVCRSHCFIRCC